MMKMKFAKRPLIVGAALVAGLGIGVGTSTLAIASDNGAPQGGAGVYKVNVHGKSYGSIFDSKSPTQEPDLIQAIGINGKTGYVRNEDLNPPLPKNPQEALAQQKAAETPKRIPVYAEDGVTVIDTFIVGGPPAAPQGVPTDISK